VATLVFTRFALKGDVGVALYSYPDGSVTNSRKVVSSRRQRLSLTTQVQMHHQVGLGAVTRKA
jgi:hypothetical protein